MLLASAFEDDTKKAQCNYVKYWLGEEGLPLIRKWEGTGKLRYTGADPTGFKLKTYWNVLEEEFKPKANSIISISDLWTNCKTRINGAESMDHQSLQPR